jgi:ATP synthase protein I
MPSVPGHSGEMSQNSEREAAHHSSVAADPTATDELSGRERPLASEIDSRALRPAIDPAARKSKKMYDGLSASSVGLELGIAVILGVLFGMWLDRQLGTEPWMMLLFLGFGLVAGFRNVLRAVARAEKAGS